jgi:YHS domain-containing protein
MVRHTLVLLALLTVVGCNELQGKRPPRAANEPKSIVNTDDNGLALQGYDPVAFFTDRKPVKGESDIQSTYKRATYHFASQDHKRLFDSDPAKYEPQFGGYCGYAASIDKISLISVDYWEIIDGRLVLQHNQKAWDLWHKDRAGNLVKADSNWPGLVNRYGN